MKLFFDTCSKDKLLIRLDKHSKRINTVGISRNHSQLVLPALADLQNKHNLDIKKITKIEVLIGPGSYTSLRVGASIANALGFALGVPINDKKIETDLRYT